MATFNKPIITTQGLAMLKSELSGSAPLSFTKVIFTSDDYSQLSDTDVANLTDIKAKDITAQAQTFVGTDSTTKVRATADNQSSTQAFYIKGYALYAKQNSNETLFAVAVSDTSDYVPAFNNKQLSQVSYTFQFAISETDNITLSDTHDIPVTQADIQSLTTYVNSKASKLTDTINQTAQSTLSSANTYTDRAVADKATHEEVNKVKNDLQASIDTKANKTDVDSAISEANSNIATKADKADIDSAVKNINENISKKADQSSLDSVNRDVSEIYPNVVRYKGQHEPFTKETIDDFTEPCIVTLNGQWLSDFADYKDEYDINDYTLYLKVEKYGQQNGTQVVSQTAYATKTVIKRFKWINNDSNWKPWFKIGGVSELIKFVNNNFVKNEDFSSAVNNINANISNFQNQLTDFSTNSYRFRKSLSDGEDLDNVTQTGLYSFDGGVHLLNQPYNDNHWGTLRVTNYAGVICQEFMSYDGMIYRTWSGGSGWRNWEKLGGVTDLLNKVNGLYQKQGIINNGTTLDEILTCPDGQYYSHGASSCCPDGTTAWGLINKISWGNDCFIRYQDIWNGNMGSISHNYNGWTQWKML